MYKKIILLSISIISLLFLLSNPSLAETKTFIDARTNKEVRIKCPVNRVVALSLNVLQIMRTLGVKDKIVGAHDTIVQKEPWFWPDIKNLPITGSFGAPNYEKILKLCPDLVICYGSRVHDIRSKLKPLHIPVLALDLYKLSSLPQGIKILGELTGKQEKATEYLAWHKDVIDRIQEVVDRAKNSPRVYLESYSPYQIRGNKSGTHELCNLAGGKNIAASMPVSTRKVSPEWIIKQKPEVIIKNAPITHDLKKLKKIREEILQRPGWQSIPAIQNKRVYVISSHIGSDPHAIGAAYMAKWFHPKVGKSIHPQQMYCEYLKRFQGLNCSTQFASTQFVYPNK